MDLFALRCFVEVVREGSFTRAAEALFRTQPAISAQIHNLEESLGGLLIDRTAPGLLLTDRGQALFPRALDLIMEVDTLEREIQSGDGKPRGKVTVATGLSAIERLLPGILGPFHARYPEIRTTLLNRTSDGIVQAVLDGRADLGLGWLPASVPRLSTETIGHVRFAALTRRKRAPIADIKAISREPLLLFEKGVDLRTYVEGRLGLIESVMELPSIASLIAYAGHGFGTAIIPVLGASRFPATLECRYLDEVLPPLELRLCNREGAILSRAAELLGAEIREQIGKRGRNSR